MDEKNKEFLKRLHDTFRIEAEEHIRAISAGLMELEKKPGKDRFLELIETATINQSRTLCLILILIGGIYHEMVY